ncbi:hypothetical protein ACFLXJ_03160 [Chloroflexota bacterium]
MRDANYYAEILSNASGITENQAKTCLYYAAATYLIPDNLDLIAILAVIGPMGTGKTTLLAQLNNMVNEPKYIGAQSKATLRDELSGTTTAIIDEGDRTYERHLQHRYAKETSEIVHNVAKKDQTWRQVHSNIFGATIIARRTPFEDPATRSRAIVIHTRYREGKYQLSEVNTKDLERMASSAILSSVTSHRIRNNWRVLRAIARAQYDKEWLEYSRKEIRKDIKALMIGQEFEPEEAVLITLKEHMIEIEQANKVYVPEDPLISNLKSDLRQHFDLNIKSYQIKEICIELGFKVVTTNNYPRVKTDVELLGKLLKDRRLLKN